MRKNKILALLLTFVIIGLTACDSLTTIKKFTVSFETNGGSTIESISVETGKTIVAPEEPTKEGFIFAGWYFDVDFNEKFGDFETFIVEENITLYARWQEDLSDNEYTVKFHLNGGTGNAPDQVIKHGGKVTLPTGLTKPGSKLRSWYTDPDLIFPFIPNSQVVSNLDLYAKWESLVTFSGTNSGNAEYNAEDGTYSFTTTLGLFNRFSIAYSGSLLSADPEGDLIITGAFSTENQAKWDENLYCDIPDGAEAGSAIDYTTFICSSPRSVIYTVTFDPEANSLDIQAEFAPEEYEISEEGLFYLIRDNNRLISTYGDATKNADGTYSVDIELSRWWRVYLYFDGVEIDVTGEAADIKGDFGTWGGRDNPKSLYSDLENDGPNAFISSYDGTSIYRITYTPANGDVKAAVIFDVDPETDPYNPELENQVKTSFTVNVAQDTALAVWSGNDIVLRGTVDGSSIAIDNRWRTNCIVDKDGKIVYFQVNAANAYLYEGTYYAHPDYAENNPARVDDEDGWKLVVPEGCFLITGHSEKSLEFILALTGVKYASSDDAQSVVNKMGAISEGARVTYDASTGKVSVTGVSYE